MEDPESFPAIPDIEVKDEAPIDGDAFIPALEASLPYVATEKTRPILSGVTVFFGRPIEVAAGDGFRMARIVLPLEFPAEYATIIPAGSVETLIHVMAKTPRPPSQGDNLLNLLLSKRQLQIALDGKRGLRVGFGSGVSVIVKLIEGTPPTWLKLVPKEEPVLRAQLFTQELEAAVRRVGDVARQAADMVRLQFHDGTGVVWAKAEGRRVSAKVTVLDMQGAANRFALNIGYLLEYLKGKEGITNLSWTGGNAPVVFEFPKTPKVLIMPMYADWEEPLPYAEAKAESPAAPTEAPVEVATPAGKSKPRRQRSKKE